MDESFLEGSPPALRAPLARRVRRSPTLQGSLSTRYEHPRPRPPRAALAPCYEAAFPRSPFRPLRPVPSPCGGLRRSLAPRCSGFGAPQGSILRGGKMKKPLLRAGLPAPASGPTSGGGVLRASFGYPYAQGSQRPRRGPPRGALSAVGLPGANRRELRICERRRPRAKIRDSQRLRYSYTDLNGPPSRPR